MEGMHFLLGKGWSCLHHSDRKHLLYHPSVKEYHGKAYIQSAQLLRLLGADHTGLTGNNNDGGIRSADRFFHFTYKVKNREYPIY